MFKFIFNIPFTRLCVSIVKKRQAGRGFLPELTDELNRVRFGSKISRVMRKVLNLKRLQRIVGINLIAIIITMNFARPTVSAFEAKPETQLLTRPAVETPITTIVARRFPVSDSVVITQGYGIFHSGVDIDGITGDPLYPIMNGRVEIVGTDFFLGNKVVINHGNGYKSVYGHLNKILAKPNQEVDTSSKIGEMGNTGHSFGDHVHLEVYKDGRRINPLTVLPSY